MPNLLSIVLPSRVSSKNSHTIHRPIDGIDTVDSIDSSKFGSILLAECNTIEVFLKQYYILFWTIDCSRIFSAQSIVQNNRQYQKYNIFGRSSGVWTTLYTRTYMNVLQNIPTLQNVSSHNKLIGTCYCRSSEGCTRTEHPQLVPLYFMGQLLLRELARCHRLVQLVPMDMAAYYGEQLK